MFRARQPNTPSSTLPGICPVAIGSNRATNLPKCQRRLVLDSIHFPHFAEEKPTLRPSTP